MILVIEIPTAGESMMRMRGMNVSKRRANSRSAGYDTVASPFSAVPTCTYKIAIDEGEQRLRADFDITHVGEFNSIQNSAVNGR